MQIDLATYNCWEQINKYLPVASIIATKGILMFADYYIGLRDKYNPGKPVWITEIKPGTMELPATIISFITFAGAGIRMRIEMFDELKKGS